MGQITVKLPRDNTSRRVRIDLISFVNIAFFLLAASLFMVGSNRPDRGIPVQLIKSVSATSVDRNDGIVVTVADSGNIFLDGQPVTLKDLVKKLREVKELDSFRPIILKSDAQLKYKESITILDKIRYIGLENIYLSTQ